MQKRQERNQLNVTYKDLINSYLSNFKMTYLFSRKYCQFLSIFEFFIVGYEKWLWKYNLLCLIQSFCYPFLLFKTSFIISQLVLYYFILKLRISCSRSCDLDCFFYYTLTRSPSLTKLYILQLLFLFRFYYHN